MSLKKDTQKSAKSSAANGKQDKAFTAEERAAMKERAKELKAAANKEEAERAVVEKIAEMTGSDRTMAERIHDIVKSSAPTLSPKLWYGQPAYADNDGKIICFFQPAEKFNTRYATLGFNEAANLDDGDMWATAFALKELNAAEEAKIRALVTKAVS